MPDIRQWRLWLRIENFGILLAAMLAYHHGNYNWWLFAVLFLVPDVSMLGYMVDRYFGAVIYNIGHTYLAPTLLAAFAFATDDQRFTPIAIIWVAHIAFDRLLGFGLKSVSGFRNTHLGFVGKNPDIQE